MSSDFTQITGQEIIDTYGSVNDDGNVVLDFGSGNSITFVGITDPNDLADDICWEAFASLGEGLKQRFEGSCPEPGTGHFNRVEVRAVDRAVRRPGCAAFIDAQAGDERPGAPVARRGIGFQPGAARRSAPQGFVDGTPVDAAQDASWTSPGAAIRIVLRGLACAEAALR